MEHQINILTLGVKDLDKMRNWYKEKFGWIPVRNNEGTVFFRLDALVLVLVHENQLAGDLCEWREDTGFRGFTLTIGFNSEKEVDGMFDELRKKGVMIVREPEKVSGGVYKGYISDPENNFWELAFYPFIRMNNAAERFLLSEMIYQS